MKVRPPVGDKLGSMTAELGKVRQALKKSEDEGARLRAENLDLREMLNQVLQR